MTEPLDTVGAWGRALAALDEEALLALADEEIEIATPRGSGHGHEALRTWLAKQTYGVVPHVEQLRYFARGDTVVAEVRVELRYHDGGELAAENVVAAAYMIADGLVRRVVTHPDLATALAAAGLSEADEVEFA